jgi:hypothetical protein
MSRDLLSQRIPEDSLTYADSLYRYASARLDEFSLRCWVIRRLMLDDGLEHESAERAFEHARENGTGDVLGRPHVWESRSGFPRWCGSMRHRAG